MASVDIRQVWQPASVHVRCLGVAGSGTSLASLSAMMEKANPWPPRHLQRHRSNPCARRGQVERHVDEARFFSRVAAALSESRWWNQPVWDTARWHGAPPAHEQAIVNVVWLPPEYGDAIACACADGTLSLWEEVAADDQLPTWRKCKVFEEGNSHILNVHFGLHLGSLKMVTAYSDGRVKVYELLDSLELDKWQLQAEFQNITDPISTFGKPACTSASIAWNPRRGGNQQASFAIGFNSDSPHFNSCKIWEFEEAHQRWLPLVELGSPEDKGDRVCAVAWAPNIGRPYEIIAVATCKGIAIWHIGLNTDADSGPSARNVALLNGHDGEVWQLEWDMGGMTLASTGGDGMVKLWQSNLDGVWHEQAVLDCSGSHA